MKALRFWLINLGVLGGVVPYAMAQDPSSPTIHTPPNEIPSIKQLEIGWDPFLQLGGNLNLMDASNVVGQKNGTTITAGGFITSAIDYLKRNHEWKNTLRLQLQYTREPVLEEFIKSRDQLILESLYLYHFSEKPRWGPFAQFSLATSIFKGEDVQSEAVTYAITDRAGRVTQNTGSTLRLTDSFKPLTLKEAIGLFFRPLNQPKISIELRLGGAARQTFANGQFVSLGQPAANQAIEIREIGDFKQLGLNGVLLVKGQPIAKQLHYSIFADSLLPLYTAPSVSGKSSIDLMNYRLGGDLSYQFTRWLSLNYEYAAIKEPQVLDRWQQSHALLLSFGFTPVKSQSREESSG